MNSEQYHIIADLTSMTDAKKDRLLRFVQIFVDKYPLLFNHAFQESYNFIRNYKDASSLESLEADALQVVSNIFIDYESFSTLNKITNRTEPIKKISKTLKALMKDDTDDLHYALNRIVFINKIRQRLTNKTQAEFATYDFFNKISKVTHMSLNIESIRNEEDVNGFMSTYNYTNSFDIIHEIDDEIYFKLFYIIHHFK